MRWLLQSVFDRDPKVQELKSNLERFEIPYSNCRVIPFSEDGIEFEDGNTIESLKDEFVFVYGSYTLARIAKKYFNPASFISPNLAIHKLFEHYGNEMFNSDMIVAPLKTLECELDSFFIRPAEDTKSFCGEIMSREHYYEWRQKILDNPPENYSTVTSDTIATIASLKQIDQECRCFVICDRVVTASQYKQDGKPFFHPHVDEYIIDYANDVIKMWKPDEAFCLDIAVANGVPKIMETNCINSSGLYCIDTQRLIMGVDELERRYTK
jgi:hypothetical protein